MTDEAKIKFAELCGLEYVPSGMASSCYVDINGKMVATQWDYHPDRDLNQAVLNMSDAEADSVSNYLFGAEMKYPTNPLSSAKEVIDKRSFVLFLASGPEAMAARIVEAKLKVAEGNRERS